MQSSQPNTSRSAGCAARRSARVGPRARSAPRPSGRPRSGCARPPPRRGHRPQSSPTVMPIAFLPSLALSWPVPGDPAGRLLIGAPRHRRPDGRIILWPVRISWPLRGGKSHRGCRPASERGPPRRGTGVLTPSAAYHRRRGCPNEPAGTERPTDKLHVEGTAHQGIRRSRRDGRPSGQPDSRRDGAPRDAPTQGSNPSPRVRYGFHASTATPATSRHAARPATRSWAGASESPTRAGRGQRRSFRSLMT